MSADQTLGDDLLVGAAEIAQFLFNDPKKRRRVYHLVEHSKLPVFWLGKIICGRKSTLRGFIVDQERQAMRKVR
jgi:hypothetical protein